jgi:hypothetical protein
MGRETGGWKRVVMQYQVGGVFSGGGSRWLKPTKHQYEALVCSFHAADLHRVPGTLRVWVRCGAAVGLPD